MPVDQLTNIKMSRLRLTLVDGRRVNPTVWTPESKWCQQHPAWQHELVWACTEDGTTRPPGSYFHTPRYTTNTSSTTTTPPASMDHNKASSLRYSCRCPKYFFTRHTEDTLTDHLRPLAPYSRMPSLVTTTNPIYLNFTNGYPMLPLTRLANPSLLIKETLYLRRRPWRQPKWKRSRKTSDKTGILRSRVSSRNTKLIRSMGTLRSTRAYSRLSPVTGRW